MNAPTPPVMNPDVDLTELLLHRISDTADLTPTPDGFRIKIFHAGGFPWGEVFKIFLYRGYSVRVTHYKADLFIEAQAAATA